MDTTEDLRALVDDVPVGPPPLAVMLGARRRRRRARTVVALTVAGVVAVVGGVVVAVERGSGVDVSGPSFHRPPDNIDRIGALTWTRLPPAPLSARSGSLGAWTGREVLFVGGIVRTFSGPAAFTGSGRRDGAAYDPATGRWRSIAKAPLGIQAGEAHVMVGDRLVVIAGRGDWLVYDSSSDRWSHLPSPPRQPISQPTLTVDGNRVYVLSEYPSESKAPVQVLDLDDRTWSSLPPSPLQPPLDGRQVVWTSAGLVVMAAGRVPYREGPHQPPEGAELWDGSRWTRYADAPTPGAGYGWQWTGTRLVPASRNPRTEALDPVTGRWSALPPRRETRGGLQSDLYLGGGTRVIADGFVYDESTRHTVALPAPPGPSYGSVGAALDGDLLYVFGGSRAKPGTSQGLGGGEIENTADAWLVRLP